MLSSATVRRRSISLISLRDRAAADALLSFSVEIRRNAIQLYAVVRTLRYRVSAVRRDIINRSVTASRSLVWNIFQSSKKVEAPTLGERDAAGIEWSDGCEGRMN